MTPPFRPALALLLATLLAIAAPPTAGAELTRTGPGLGVIAGDIGKGDGARIAAELAISGVRAVELRSGGGYVAEAIAIAEAIRAAGIVTVAPRDALCASSCFLMLIAGSGRFVHERGAVGVHRSRRQNGADAGAGDNDRIAAVARRFGASEAVIALMLETPHTTARWLDEAELKATGIDVMR